MHSWYWIMTSIVLSSLVVVHLHLQWLENFNYHWHHWSMMWRDTRRQTKFNWISPCMMRDEIYNCWQSFYIDPARSRQCSAMNCEGFTSGVRSREYRIPEPTRAWMTLIRPDSDVKIFLNWSSVCLVHDVHCEMRSDICLSMFASELELLCQQCPCNKSILFQL